MMTLLGFRQGLLIGAWTIFATLSIYFLMVGLARARLKVAGIGPLLRLVAVIAIAVAAGWILWADVVDGDDRVVVRALAEGNARTLESPFNGTLSRVILFVPRLVATAAFPPSAGHLALSSLVLIALALTCFFIAVRIDVSFEDASIALAQKKLERTLELQRHRTGQAVSFKRFPPLFHLRPAHPRELAILWKNLIASMRIASPWMVILVVTIAGLTAGSFVADEPAIDLMLGMMALLLAAAFPFVGTTLFGQDLRLDLSRIDLLKSYPITGERLLLSEIGAPLAIVSTLEMLFLIGAGTILGQLEKPGPFHFFGSPEFIVVALLFAIPICAAQLVIHNAAPILLPAWALRSKEESRGFAVTGQRLVLLLASMLVLALVLLPPAILLAPLLFIAHRFFDGNPAMLAIGTMPSVALLTFEVWIGVRLLGAQIDRLDVSNELELVPV